MPKRPSNIYALLGIRKNSWAAVALAVLLLVAAELHNTFGGKPDMPATAEPTIDTQTHSSEATGLILGKVVKVADGDTVTVLSQDGAKLKVRLLGIDAPEKNQKHGLAASHWLSNRLIDKQVALQTAEKDRYGRLVSKILTAKPSCPDKLCPLDEDINLTLVRLGHAWWYKAYAKNQPVADRTTYEQAQTQAQAERLGLWAYPEPLAPWEFRRQKREQRNP